MKTRCPHCSQRYEIDDEFNNQNVECSQCENGFTAKPIIDTISDSSMEERGIDNLCPFCRAKIAEDAKKCCHCGEWVIKEATPVIKPTSKNEIIFVLLGLLLGWIGIHNFYVNEKAAGFGKILLSYLGIQIIHWFPHSRLGIVILLLNAIWIIIEIIKHDKHIKRSEISKRSYKMAALNATTAILFLFFAGCHAYIEATYEEIGDISFRAGQAGARTIYNPNIASFVENEKELKNEQEKRFINALKIPLIDRERLVKIGTNRYKEGSTDVTRAYKTKGL